MVKINSIEEIISKCKICEKKGYIRKKTKGKITECKCVKSVCKCAGQEPYLIQKESGYEECICKPVHLTIKLIRRNFHIADIPAKYRWKFFEDLNLRDKKNSEITGIKKLVKNIEKTLNNYNKNKEEVKGLVLWSPITGNGKTLSNVIILNTLMFEYGITGKFIKLSSDFFNRIKLTYRNGSRLNELMILRNLINYDALVIDDFGVERGTEWEQEKLYELIDGRNNSNKLTLISTNTDLSNIKRDAAKNRILSRLMEMCVISKVTTPNYRENYLQEN